MDAVNVADKADLGLNQFGPFVISRSSSVVKAFHHRARRAFLPFVCFFCCWVFLFFFLDFQLSPWCDREMYDKIVKAHQHRMGLKVIMRHAEINNNAMQMKSCLLVLLFFVMLFSKACVCLSCQIKCKLNQKYLWFICT